MKKGDWEGVYLHLTIGSVAGSLVMLPIMMFLYHWTFCKWLMESGIALMFIIAGAHIVDCVVRAMSGRDK